MSDFLGTEYICGCLEISGDVQRLCYAVAGQGTEKDGSLDLWRKSANPGGKKTAAPEKGAAGTVVAGVGVDSASGPRAEI